MNSFSSAFSSIRRSPYQAIAAVMISTVTFAVIFALSYFLSGAQQVLNYYETRPQIIAFFEIEASEEDINGASEEMKNKQYVTDVKVTTKEQALELYSQEYSDSPMLLELVTADILPASLEVSASSIDALPQVKSDLENLSGIDTVEFQEQVVATLRSWTNSARVLGVGSAIILAGLSFLVITVIVGMRVSMQKRKIAIMRLIGATRWYVKRPFMVEGMIYSSLGAVFGWLIATGVVIYFAPNIRQFVTEISLFPIPLEFFVVQFGIGLAVAMLLGLFAGLTASQRLIRQ